MRIRELANPSPVIGQLALAFILLAVIILRGTTTGVWTHPSVP